MRSQQEPDVEEEKAESVAEESTEEQEMIESPKISPEEATTSVSYENTPKSPENVSEKVNDKTEAPSPDSQKIPESKPEPETVVVIHEVTIGKKTEILENGEHRVSISENSTQDKFVEILVEENNEARTDEVSADPFVDDYDSDHSSLASDISYPELLELITNLDSD
ncbi:unnamed protein product [Oikopleura dioica]|uniref:Uncharacterized protein n=1 Tax=Oikopleura dioica TaxID=34765 RepID=E4XXH9_OIKDI|nr:unnamed protein product [Oikopleura dioica]CBY39879.1 unnamed protein product [Oikopleura dioica]